MALPELADSATPREPESDPRVRLFNIIRDRSFSTGSDKTLASGRVSNFYFNMKSTMLHPEGAALIAELMLQRLATEEVDFVGGLEMGAVPIATAVATHSVAYGRPLPAFFVRKETKAHGTKSRVEGLAADETLAGRKVCVLEDVTTTGGSALQAVDVLRELDAEVTLVLTVVDREEGAIETFNEAGLRFDALMYASEFRS